MDNERGDPADHLTPAQVRDLATKGWLTHDGMWFGHAAAALGMEGANDLNRAAIAAMAPFEVRRLCEALAVDPAALRDPAAIAGFVAAGVRLVTPESVSSHLRVAPTAQGIRWEWDPGECFAYKGMQRFGLLDGYRCGVIYRIECWLDALGARRRGEPVVEGCLMHASGRCAGDLALIGLV